MEVSRRAFVSGLVLAACGDGADAGRASSHSAGAVDARSAATSAPDPARTAGHDGAAPPPGRVPLLRERFTRAIPFLSIASAPSPLLEAASLGRAVGVGSLWIKRDDRASDVFGGSKLRKLEWLLGDARARGATTLVTFGGAGSNQAVATAAFGTRQGFRVRVLLAPQPKSEVVRKNLRACVRFGATIEAIDGVVDAERRERARADARTYVVPAGGSTPLGNLGFVEAALELDAQTRATSMPPFDVIVLALGTSGSAAGLAVGLEALGLPTRILGVRASSDAYSSAERVRDAVRALATFVGAEAPSLVTRDAQRRVEIDASALGHGYGSPSAAATNAAQIAREHGLALEPVYCAKAFAGLRAHAHDLSRARVLVWLTQPEWPGPPVATIDERAIPARLRPFL